MGRNAFTDPNRPASTVPPRNPYLWPTNHSSEDNFGRARTISTQQPTAAGWKRARPILQQGAGGPRVMTLQGSIFDEDQHRMFLRFFELCGRQSIHFTHCEGGKYEVLITRYEPTRTRVVRAPRGGTRIWRYTLEMEVLNELT